MIIAWVFFIALMLVYQTDRQKTRDRRWSSTGGYYYAIEAEETKSDHLEYKKL